MSSLKESAQGTRNVSMMNEAMQSEYILLHKGLPTTKNLAQPNLKSVEISQQKA